MSSVDVNSVSLSEAVSDRPSTVADVETRPVRRSIQPASLVSGFLVALPVGVIAFLGWNRRWMSDDGFINIRVIANLFDGYGPVFNVGERVEVGTSTAWLAVLAAGHAVTPFLAVSRLAVWTGLLATVIGLVAVSAGAATLCRLQGRTGPLLPFGTLVLAALPPFWDFATSGLETGLVFLWLGASFYLLGRRLDRIRDGRTSRTEVWQPLWPALLIGIGPLVRPDLTLIAAALGVALLFQSRRSWRSWIGGAVVALAAPVLYELFRAGYYAALVPNTALAKGAGESLWRQGLTYLDDYAGRYLLLVPLCAGIVLWVPRLVSAARRTDLAVAALLVLPVLGAALHAVFVLRVGGDFMHGRFLLPATFAAAMPIAVLAAGRGAAARVLTLAPLAVVLVWSVTVGTQVRVPYTNTIGPAGIADERGVYVNDAGTPKPVIVEAFAEPGSIVAWYEQAVIARTLAESGERVFLDNQNRVPVADGYTVVTRMGNIGIFGVRAGPQVFVADRLSLANPIGARLDIVEVENPRIGHSQEVPLVWDLARFTATTPGDAPDVRAGREALACGELRDLQMAVTGPMTVQRFVRNVVDASHLTRLRIPADPFVARDQFCAP